MKLTATERLVLDTLRAGGNVNAMGAGRRLQKTAWMFDAASNVVAKVRVRTLNAMVDRGLLAHERMGRNSPDAGWVLYGDPRAE